MTARRSRSPRPHHQPGGAGDARDSGRCSPAPDRGAGARPAGARHAERRVDVAAGAGRRGGRARSRLLPRRRGGRAAPPTASSSCSYWAATAACCAAPNWPGLTGRRCSGVNLGHVGFLAEAEPDALPSVVERVVARDYDVEERMTVDVSVRVGGQLDVVGLGAERGRAGKGSARADGRVRPGDRRTTALAMGL